MICLIYEMASIIHTKQYVGTVVESYFISNFFPMHEMMIEFIFCHKMYLRDGGELKVPRKPQS